MVDVAQVGADRPGEDYLVEPELHFLERHRQLGLVGFGKREQEFLVLVLGDQLDERRERSVGENILRLRYTMYFCRYSATASVLQKYFIPSGIVMRACSQIRKSCQSSSGS